MRYYYYLILVNMIVNVLAYTPRILIRDRFNGAVLALPVSTVLGMAFLLTFSYAIKRFPMMGLPEMLAGVFPSALIRLMMLLFSTIWFTAGALSVLVTANLTNYFINPSMPSSHVVFMYLIVICFVMQCKSQQVLYVVEMIFILSFPLVAFIFFKASISSGLRFDSMMTVVQTYKQLPTVSSLASATYIFSGYANMVIFNRVFPKFTMKWLWVFAPIGLSILLTTMFLPIGFLGADGVKDYLFPWLSTADSMRVEFGFVERVLYIFYILYGEIAFISVVIHFHVALELIKSAANKSSRTFSWCVTALMCGTAVFMSHDLDEYPMFRIGEYWMSARMGGEIFLLLILLYTLYKKRRSPHEA
ncbi:GerAB/ArcD/ProY family transporter [Paenibacillus athensensis]|uniref:Spore germination protein n=1 Tax=Paenibacillus athensensis TaxID=1967502 RepID=A0A4Y8Q5E7_9BACL|nr:GerAB/ArcD/ProY family transporter [Paenibacillus athensensis]MCD1259262.1 GerAB/ArcD/ProY family transporter [Paenibacillus athensensis]